MHLTLFNTLIGFAPHSSLNQNKPFVQPKAKLLNWGDQPDICASFIKFLIVMVSSGLCARAGEWGNTVWYLQKFYLV